MSVCIYIYLGLINALTMQSKFLKGQNITAKYACMYVCVDVFGNYRTIIYL